MEEIIEYILANYTLFLAGTIIILLAIIGSYADKTNFGQGKKEEPKEKTKEELIKENLEGKTLNEAIGQPINQENNSNESQPIEELNNNKLIKQSESQPIEDTVALEEPEDIQYKNLEQQFNEILPEKDIIDNDILDEVSNDDKLLKDILNYVIDDIRSLYLYNEYLPVEYDTQRILFSKNQKPIWLVLGIDFKDFDKDILNWLSSSIYRDLSLPIYACGGDIEKIKTKFELDDEIGFYDIPKMILEFAEVKTNALFLKDLDMKVNPKFIQDYQDILTIINMRLCK